MKYILKEYPDLLEKAESMSTDELLLSVISPNITVGKHTPPRNTTSVFIHPTDTESAKATAYEINRDRETPALIVSDMEYGAGSAVAGAVEFPSMMAATAAGDEALAYEMGVVAAQEALTAGYQWTFGPCVDILMNHASPIVSIRTAADNADDVIKYSGAYMRGLQDAGLIATLKHFPGDGCSPDDQHLAPTVNPLSRKEWDESFGRVYSTLIGQGAMAIMPGHISLPAYDTPDENGIYPPATVSRTLLTDLLKTKLGFEGIIVSDAVNMGGFCGYKNLYEASAMFLEAGGDCLLFMHGDDEYFSEMKKHIESGLLKRETLKNRAYRMMCFCRHYYEILNKLDKKPFDRAYAEAVSRKMVNKCVQIDYDRAHILPYDVKHGAKIAHVIIANAGMTNVKAATDLTSELCALGADVTEFTDPGPDALRTMAKSKEYELIICSVFAGASWGLNTSKLCGPAARNMMCGWTRFGTPCVFVNYKNPYLKEQYFATIDTLINTYGTTDYTPRAVINRITGK